MFIKEKSVYNKQQRVQISYKKICIYDIIMIALINMCISFEYILLSERTYTYVLFWAIILKNITLIHS